MHIKDLELLLSLKNYFGVGNVRTSGKFAYYEVNSKVDIKVIINHFQLYPLQTSKKHSFYIFIIFILLFIFITYMLVYYKC